MQKADAEKKIEAIDREMRRLFDEWCQNAPVAQRLLGQKDICIDILKGNDDAGTTSEVGREESP